MNTTTAVEKRCEVCLDVIIRGRKVGTVEWDRKRYCSNGCRAEAMARRNANPEAYRLERQLTVPESARRVATWDGVPRRCPHCAGLWRRLEASVCCKTCGRDLYVSEALAAAR